MAQLERILGGTNVTVTSPDSLVDVRTGLTRQVGVTLRIQLDSKPVLIILECRKWDTVQDVTCIDELATRCRVLGATKIIAVTSKGFSKGARAAAKHEGIELRTVAELTGQTVFGWLGIESIATYPSNLDVTGIRLYIEGADPNKLPSEYWDAPNAVEAMTAEFLIQPDGQRRSIPDVWNNIDKHDLFESLPPSTRRPSSGARTPQIHPIASTFRGRVALLTLRRSRSTERSATNSTKCRSSVSTSTSAKMAIYSKSQKLR